MTARDAMEFINEQDEATLQRFVERLEFRGKDPTFVGYREAYVDKMALDRTADVLELGCGTGVVTRALAGRDGFEGRVIGIEQSPVLVDVARRLAAEEGVGDRIEFRVGDIHALDVPDASVDAVVAHTTMSHVTDPRTVLERGGARPSRRWHLCRLRRRLRVVDLRLPRSRHRNEDGGRDPNRRRVEAPRDA